MLFLYNRIGIWQKTTDVALKKLKDEQIKQFMEEANMLSYVLNTLFQVQLFSKKLNM